MGGSLAPSKKPCGSWLLPDAPARFSRGIEFLFSRVRQAQGFSAMRRIDAMRMLKVMPELETSIESGELTLTNLSLVKQASETHRKTTLEKRALLEVVKEKSKRECERILAREMPEMIPAEKERVLTETYTEVRVVLNERQRGKLNRLKALLSHKNPNPTYAELIEILSDVALKKLDPFEKKPKKKSAPKTKAPTDVEQYSSAIRASALGTERASTPRNQSTTPAEFQERGENQSWEKRHQEFYRIFHLFLCAQIRSQERSDER